MNDFKNLTLDELVEISGEDDEWFEQNYEKVDGYYTTKLKNSQ